MAVFKGIARYELVVVFVQFLLGNSYLLLPASPACCSDLLYPRVALLSGLLLLTTLAAATILLWVLMALTSPHPKVKVAAAVAYKQQQGAASVGWKLRVLLLVAIGLSAASTFLAVHTFQSGYGYRKGCVYCRDPVAMAAMGMMEFYHALAALLVVVAVA